MVKLKTVIRRGGDKKLSFFFTIFFRFFLLWLAFCTVTYIKLLHTNFPLGGECMARRGSSVSSSCSPLLSLEENEILLVPLKNGR